MIRISLTYLYDLANALRPLDSIEAPTKLRAIYFDLYRAESTLEALHSQSFYAEVLRSSYQPAQNLLQSIKKLTNQSDFEKEIASFDIYVIKQNLAQYETVLKAEFAVADAYFVTRKAGQGSMYFAQ